MTPPDFDKIARDVRLCAGHEMLRENRMSAADKIIRSALEDAWNAALEDAAETCIRIWREASNERTDSALTSYMQNSLSHGCVASAKAVRSRKIVRIA